MNHKTKMKKAASQAASLPGLRKSCADTSARPSLPQKPASERRLTGCGGVRTGEQLAALATSYRGTRTCLEPEAERLTSQRVLRDCASP